MTCVKGASLLGMSNVEYGVRPTMSGVEPPGQAARWTTGVRGQSERLGCGLWV